MLLLLLVSPLLVLLLVVQIVLMVMLLLISPLLVLLLVVQICWTPRAESAQSRSGGSRGAQTPALGAATGCE
ncbi:unnamed protein product [Lampetra planeri]